MDAKSRFFARMDASLEMDRRKGAIDDLSSEGGVDQDIDFGVTESGRTTILAKYGGAGMDDDDDEDDNSPDDMDFSILTTARTFGNTERSMMTIATIGTIDTEGDVGSISSSIMEITNSTRSAGIESQKMENSSSSAKDQLERGEPRQQPEQQQQQQFQPLHSLPRQRSAPRAIPKPQQQQQQVTPPAAAPYHHQSMLGGAPQSQPSSVGSSASAFINNLLDPTASTFNNTQMSHTPPTHVSTSYEASHFGKRARSGSISERLRVSSELEQKGMIDTMQKGILKDLIISGQDNELQHALDRYEQGDASILENMLASGTLADRATTDIDLLGDLDLDFLNVNDAELVAAGVGSSSMSGNQQQQQQQQHHHSLVGGLQGGVASASSAPMRPPPSLPTKHQILHHHQRTPDGVGSAGVATQNNMLSYEATDGIGELDFDGGIGGSDGNYGVIQSDRSLSPAYDTGQRSRSNSTFSFELDYRQRSNSLFSALIGSVPHESTPPEYGRWMEQRVEDYSNHVNSASASEMLSTEGVRIDKPLRRASAPEMPSGLSVVLSSQGGGDVKMSAAARRELRAEEKRREKQEKKEQREREKREKKEKREQAKIEKQQKKAAESEEHKIEHLPGSGRPRSMSDPNLRSMVDDNGLLHVERPEGWIGAYSPESRKVRIERFLEKRNHRVWTKTVKYDVRKNFADSRLRVKGRFVKKEDELMMRELMSLT